MLLTSTNIPLKHSIQSSPFQTTPPNQKYYRNKLTQKKYSIKFGGVVVNCAPDVYPEIDEEKFKQETQEFILRSLTGQAAKKVMYQLQESDLYAAQWFNSFCSKHSPLKGDEFIEELMTQRMKKKQDIFNKVDHFISPIEIAHRVLITRADLANALEEKLEFTTSYRTVELQRKFLEDSYKFENQGEELEIQRKKIEEDLAS
eukprot:TRINITY_DN19586_c1_g1_i1.p1 TRINITY_DN19586_c1_g1~~TRINITY_DN19586_c1_g1_i1.p1  ORF type:complete len:202 (-),score=40.18 TRINITY_DN19586_c1_g1_i1:259-864(-)